MKIRSRWFIKIVLFLLICIVTYMYQNSSFHRTANSFHFIYGEKFSFTYRHIYKQDNYYEQHRTFKGPLQDLQIKILVWAQSLTLPNQTKNLEAKLFPNYGKPQYQCPIDYLFVTGKEEENYADAVIIDAKQPGFLPKKIKSIPWILYYDEPPIINKHLENETFMNYFNYSIGYRMDSDFPNPLISEPTMSEPLHFHQKYDYPAAVFSTCKGIRTKYIRELSKYIRIKSYGDCLRNVEKNNILGKGENNFVDSKINLFKMHKFAFSLMRFDCEDYIDETLNHVWEAGALPIYFGTDTLQKMLPVHLRTSIVPVSRFSTPKDLAVYLMTLINDKTQYSKLMVWRYKAKDYDDDSPLSKVWNPRYSPGCKIALTLQRDRLAVSRNKTKTLKPIQCTERSLHEWLSN